MKILNQIAVYQSFDIISPDIQHVHNVKKYTPVSGQLGENFSLLLASITVPCLRCFAKHPIAMNRRIQLLVLAAGLGLSACGSFRPFAQPGGDLPVSEYESPNTILADANKPAKKTKPKGKNKPKPEAVAPLSANAKTLPAPAMPTEPKPQPKTAASPAPAKVALNADAQAIMDGLKGASPQVRGVVQEALTYLGTPYKWGGMSKTGVDCSGLMCLAFAAANMELPRTSGDQAALGKQIAKTAVKPGDLLFFSADKPGVIGHSALVVAVGQNSVRFVHASSFKGVRIDELYTDHWTKVYITARRLLN